MSLTCVKCDTETEEGLFDMVSGAYLCWNCYYPEWERDFLQRRRTKEQKEAREW